MAIVKYNKLVRDEIPNIIKRDGKKARIRKLDDKEYINALNSKLREELQEYIEINNIEELADMVEVIYGILDYNGVSIEEFEEIRKKRNLSQEELGLKIGVKKSQISKIESGYDNISLKIISKVFVALNAKLKISVVLDDEDQLDFP